MITLSTYLQMTLLHGAGFCGLIVIILSDTSLCVEFERIDLDGKRSDVAV